MRAAIVCLALSGCSWIFMDKPESHYTRDTQPQCSEGEGWPVLDSIFAVGNGLSIAAVATSDVFTTDEKTELILGDAAWMLIHIASASSGFGYASDCTKARVAYEKRDADETPEERRKRAYEEYDARQKAAEDHARQIASQPAPPRGFYCSSSPTVQEAGLCVRDKAECVRARDAALAGVADLTECTLEERAFCFGDHCAPSNEACEAMRVRAIGPDGNAPVCADSE